MPRKPRKSEVFGVGVGMHQGLGLSPLLFATVMEEIPRAFQFHLLW